MKVLVITDIQFDFLPGGALAVPGGDEIIPVINKLQDQFDLVVATQDWHPPKHRSFASFYPGKKTYDTVSIHGLEQVLWPDHCVQNSKGAELDPGLDQSAIAAVFRKGMDPEVDSYSAFFDNDRIISTGLADYLRGKGATDVYICGLAGDFCVAYSAMDSLREGFNTYVIEEGTKPINPEGFEKFKREFAEKGGRVISSRLIG